MAVGDVYETRGLRQGFDGGGLSGGVYRRMLRDMGGKQMQNGGERYGGGEGRLRFGLRRLPIPATSGDKHDANCLVAGEKGEQLVSLTIKILQ